MAGPERRAKRVLTGLGAALLLAGTAGAYVPSAVPQAMPRASAPAREPDQARDFDRLLSRLDAEERRLSEELDQLGPKLDTVQKRMIARGRQYYRLVRAGMLPVGGGFDGLVDHASRVERLRASLSRDIALERELRERQATDRKELRRVRTERAPLMVQREAMRVAERAMQEADERRDAFDRAFGSSNDPAHISVYGADTGPLPPDPGSRFAAMKGRLSFPLAGRAEVADKDGSIGPGMQLRASRDTAARAVYPGTVVFVGQRDFGTTVVIDHGDGYFSVYGNLQRLDVKTGDVLAERGRIGWVLRHGSRPPILYFELRRGKQVMEAGPWLGL
jgi:murein hydrolase activator